MVQLKFGPVSLEEGSSLRVELLEDHVQVEADEDGEEDADQFGFALVEGLVDKYFEFLIALAVVVGVAPRVHVLVLGGLGGVLAFTKQFFVVLHEGLQVFDGKSLHIATF